MKTATNTSIKDMEIGQFFIFNNILMKVHRNRLNVLQYELFVEGTSNGLIKWFTNDNEENTIESLGIELLSKHEVHEIKSERPHLFL